MLYMSNSNSIILIILCIIVLIVQCLHNVKLNLMWYTIFINKTMILSTSGAGLQSNQSISKHCLPSSSSRREPWPSGEMTFL